MGEILLLRIIANLWIPIYGLLNNDFLIVKFSQKLEELIQNRPRKRSGKAKVIEIILSPLKLQIELVNV